MSEKTVTQDLSGLEVAAKVTSFCCWADVIAGYDAGVH